MRVRFTLPSKTYGEKPRFDKTVDLPYAPDIGEDVGIDITDGPLAGSDQAWIVEVARRRLYINGEGEPVCEVWLTDDSRDILSNQYVRHGCRFGYERMMERAVERHP